MFRLCLAVKISYPVRAVQSAKFARISILRNNRKYFILLSFSLNLIIEWKRQGVLAGKDRTGGGWGNEETSVERQTGQKAYWKIFTLSASQSLRIFWNLSRTCETKAGYKIQSCDIIAVHQEVHCWLVSSVRFPLTLLYKFELSKFNLLDRLICRKRFSDILLTSQLA